MQTYPNSRLARPIDIEKCCKTTLCMQLNISQWGCTLQSPILLPTLYIVLINKRQTWQKETVSIN